MKEDLNDSKLLWTKTMEYDGDEGLTCTQYRRPQMAKTNNMINRIDIMMKNVQLKTVEYFWNNQDKYGTDPSVEEIKEVRTIKTNSNVKILYYRTNLGMFATDRESLLERQVFNLGPFKRLYVF